MKNILLIIFVSSAFLFPSCEIFILGMFEKTTRDEMYDYMQDADKWQVISVSHYKTERDNRNDSFTVVLDSTWYPGGSIIFKDGKENDDFLYKPLTYTDANGNSTIAEYDLYPDDEKPVLSFYEWDDYPFPHQNENTYLEVWENGRLSIASRADYSFSQSYIVIEMEEK